MDFENATGGSGAGASSFSDEDFFRMADTAAARRYQRSLVSIPMGSVPNTEHQKGNFDVNFKA